MPNESTHNADCVAFLRLAVDLLATVDDAHHPWSHNAYMAEVDRLLLEVQPLLNDGITCDDNT